MQDNIVRYCKERCHCCYVLLKPDELEANLCKGCQDAKTAKALGVSYGQFQAMRRDREVVEQMRWKEKKKQHKAILEARRKKVEAERKRSQQMLEVDE